MPKEAPRHWDRKMQQRLARGEAAALGELYDRFASLVHSLAHRVLDDEGAADRVTRDVFAHVWENPETYDPRRGPFRSWIAAIAHAQAVERLRQSETAPLTEGDGTEGRAGGGGPEQSEALEEKVRRASVAARADYIVTSMPAPLRSALELAYFQRRDYRQTAADLGVTEDEARRRLRLGLQLLSTANDQDRTARTPSSGPDYRTAI
ncbi:sigma-70 family RNA polymerase sigma factor [Streptomyces tsukubensis]|uniref:RNA polymerase subunit sigma-70 n=1 Tax=Streptomyces tsukubensis TaxID=83656 RepID=A0A1V4A072_9ACTN|nr:sigma-70 family RNA polymerase sigma factor [Streptomyces tsukubensis]OON72238.1 RNA polymerase subunit sigma-70 [Streptomyces tsukubensis]QFR94134.1 sigma-70 family RNA polymerase sigma factor [Streptomyces tsukubensis]